MRPYGDSHCVANCMAIISEHIVPRWLNETTEQFLLCTKYKREQCNEIVGSFSHSFCRVYVTCSCILFNCINRDRFCSYIMIGKKRSIIFLLFTILYYFEIFYRICFLSVILNIIFMIYIFAIFYYKLLFESSHYFTTFTFCQKIQNITLGIQDTE